MKKENQFYQAPEHDNTPNLEIINHEFKNFVLTAKDISREFFAYSATKQHIIQELEKFLSSHQQRLKFDNLQNTESVFNLNTQDFNSLYEYYSIVREASADAVIGNVVKKYSPSLHKMCLENHEFNFMIKLRTLVDNIDSNKPAALDLSKILTSASSKNNTYILPSATTEASSMLMPKQYPHILEELFVDSKNKTDLESAHEFTNSTQTYLKKLLNNAVVVELGVGNRISEIPKICKQFSISPVQYIALDLNSGIINNTPNDSAFTMTGVAGDMKEFLDKLPDHSIIVLSSGVFDGSQLNRFFTQHELSPVLNRVALAQFHAPAYNLTLGESLTFGTAGLNRAQLR